MRLLTYLLTYLPTYLPTHLPTYSLTYPSSLAAARSLNESNVFFNRFGSSMA